MQEANEIKVGKIIIMMCKSMIILNAKNENGGKTKLMKEKREAKGTKTFVVHYQ
jgi:hypothetical protein